MSAEEVAWSLILGVATGAASSFIIWLLVVRLLKPSIAISPQITRYTYKGEDQWAYRIKLLNRRRRRGAYDVVVRCDLSLPYRVVGDDRQNARIVTFHTQPENFARVAPRGNRVVRIRPADEDELRRAVESRGLRPYLPGEQFCMTDVLALPGAQLRVWVFSVDGFSSTRGIAEQVYVQGDVAVAQWNRSSLDLAAKTHEGWEARGGSVQNVPPT